MAVKPNVYPEFSTSIDADGIGTITDPVSTQQNAQPPSALGYSVTEGLKLLQFIPRQLFNHLSGLTNNWIKWLDQVTISNDANITTNVGDIAQNSGRIDALEDGLEKAFTVTYEVTIYNSLGVNSAVVEGDVTFIYGGITIQVILPQILVLNATTLDPTNYVRFVIKSGQTVPADFDYDKINGKSIVLCRFINILAAEENEVGTVSFLAADEEFRISPNFEFDAVDIRRGVSIHSYNL